MNEINQENKCFPTTANSAVTVSSVRLQRPLEGILCVPKRENPKGH